jgi:hypothetical protein
MIADGSVLVARLYKLYKNASFAYREPHPVRFAAMRAEISFHNLSFCESKALQSQPLNNLAFFD